MTIVINGTTGISGVDGSAGTPAVQGTDTNTGVFYPAADTVGVSTGGSERMRVDSSGNVGIGTSSPSARVDNTGTFRSTGATDPSSGTGLELSYRSTYGDVLAYNRTSSSFVQLQIRGEPIIFGNSGGERMRIDSSGNVGIGTSSPSVKLEVSGPVYSAQNNYIRIGNAYLSSGGDYCHLANNTYFNGSVWTSSANGAMYQMTGQAHNWYTQTSNAFTAVAVITSTGNFQFNSGYGSVATAYGCRAWVNFNGTGTVAIRASGNVTSITDNGVGDYTVNFTNAMPDANYSSNYSIGELNTNYWGPIPYIYAQTTTSCRVRSVFATGSFYDQNSCNFSVFR